MFIEFANIELDGSTISMISSVVHPLWAQRLGDRAGASLGGSGAHGESLVEPNSRTYLLETDFRTLKFETHFRT